MPYFSQFKHLSVYVYVSFTLAEAKEVSFKISSTVTSFLAKPIVNLFQLLI